MLDTTNLLWYGSIAVELLFCLYLIWTKLARTYPVFTVCLGLFGARDPWLPFTSCAALSGRGSLSLTPIFGCGRSRSGCCCRLRSRWKCTPGCGTTTRMSCAKRGLCCCLRFLMALVAAAIPVRAEARLAPAPRRLIAGDALRNSWSTRYISSVLAIFLVLSAASLFGGGRQWTQPAA